MFFILKLNLETEPRTRTMKKNIKLIFIHIEHWTKNKKTKNSTLIQPQIQCPTNPDEKIDSPYLYIEPRTRKSNIEHWTKNKNNKDEEQTLDL